MASGRWDFFDVVVTVAFLLYVFVSLKHKKGSWRKDVFLSGALGLISLVFILSAASLVGLYFGIINFATYDFDTLHQFRRLYPLNEFPNLYSKEYKEITDIAAYKDQLFFKMALKKAPQRLE